MVFILIRKIVIPVALVAAWIGTITFAIIATESHERMKTDFVHQLAVQTDQKELNDVTTLENDTNENTETKDGLERDKVATSRSGSRVNREDIPVVYYQEADVNVAENEIEMLERIAQAEAGGSGYDAMLAVINVVLNRVRSERFPNTVTDVVFANRQFTPISDGRYYTVTVSDTAKQVVSDALAGARIIGEDALYFCTPTASGKGWFERALRKIDYIAPHNFYGYKLEE